MLRLSSIVGPVHRVKISTLIAARPISSDRHHHAMGLVNPVCTKISHVSMNRSVASVCSQSLTARDALGPSL